MGSVAKRGLALERGEGSCGIQFLASKLLFPDSRSDISVLHPDWRKRPATGHGGPRELLPWKVPTQYRSFNYSRCPRGSKPEGEGKNLPGSWNILQPRLRPSPRESPLSPGSSLRLTGPTESTSSPRQEV